MKKNMGLLDRTVRAIVAIGLITLVVTGIIEGTLSIVLSTIAVIFLLTSMLSYCPLYLPLGLNTIRQKVNRKTS